MSASGCVATASVHAWQSFACTCPSDCQLHPPSSAPPAPLRREQMAYQMAALFATMGIVSVAVFATYYRIVWNMVGPAACRRPARACACWIYMGAVELLLLLLLPPCASSVGRHGHDTGAARPSAAGLETCVRTAPHPWRP